MQYAKIVEGIVARVGDLPRNLKTETNTIINFDKLPAAELKAHGYLPITDETVPYDNKYMSLGAPAYAVGEDNVVLTHPIITMDLLMYKQQKIAQAYEAANKALDALVAGYSQLEVATWPAIQADILAYDATGTVGAAMQGAIDSSGYDAADLAALILPRIQQQADIYVDRKAQVVAIMAAATHSEV